MYTNIALTIIAVFLLTVTVGIGRIREELERNTKALEKLRLTGRTKQRQGNIRNKPMDDDMELIRLGRQSKSRATKVVGGDPNSEQRQSMERGLVDDDQ